MSIFKTNLAKENVSLEFKFKESDETKNFSLE